MPPTLNQLLKSMVEMGGSDLHITTDTPPQIRVHGTLKPLDLPSLGPAETKQLAYSVLTDAQKKRFEESLELDFSFGIKGLARFRCNLFNQRGAVAAVYRLIPERIRSFEELGLPQVLANLADRPRGLVLVTGPTGSGKTTTLYSALRKLNRPELKLFTVEDPVEYQLAGINQVQVQPQIGLDFPTALRSILRQDPDIIMIGEIRDLETAHIAVQASLTGHLVFSTLHTNGAIAAIARLVDLGIERFLLASTVSGVMAQRLVRRLCVHCARPHADPKALVERLGLNLAAAATDVKDMREAVGCEACSGTGFLGRTMICESIIIDDEIRDAIGRRSEDQRSIEALARRSGFRSLFEHGAAKVFAGETSFDEVLRVTRVS
jgi:general secretion pathway protein E